MELETVLFPDDDHPAEIPAYEDFNR